MHLIMLGFFWQISYAASSMKLICLKLPSKARTVECHSLTYQVPFSFILHLLNYAKFLFKKYELKLVSTGVLISFLIKLISISLIIKIRIFYDSKKKCLTYRFKIYAERIKFLSLKNREKVWTTFMYNIQHWAWHFSAMTEMNASDKKQ